MRALDVKLRRGARRRGGVLDRGGIGGREDDGIHGKKVATRTSSNGHSVSACGCACREPSGRRRRPPVDRSRPKTHAGILFAIGSRSCYVPAHACTCGADGAYRERVGGVPKAPGEHRGRGDMEPFPFGLPLVLHRHVVECHGGGIRCPCINRPDRPCASRTGITEPFSSRAPRNDATPLERSKVRLAPVAVVRIGGRLRAPDPRRASSCRALVRARESERERERDVGERVSRKGSPSRALSIARSAARQATHPPGLSNGMGRPSTNMPQTHGQGPGSAAGGCEAVNNPRLTYIATTKIVAPTNGPFSHESARGFITVGGGRGPWVHLASLLAPLATGPPSIDVIQPLDSACLASGHEREPHFKSPRQHMTALLRLSQQDTALDARA
ncbi:hypothetical protein BDY21DRAFT_77439 [Lineolata rhizophorae]|uniref:Uncharacterized protein n=1 Tax=Lineolata rhizophorae TaxID=578093 RepID=A0A6A6NTE2_9PEZI|nr:hypothetical protein BDY21DRAFT_77439 [Lineolata rhizophorae]